MTSTTNQVASYKGKKYRLLWIGDTKYGRRAHLGFFSGDKDFWVDASAVTVSENAPRRQSSSRGPSRGRRTGCACGSIEGEYHDWYCASCRFDELDM
jgi:hypothetical protein